MTRSRAEAVLGGGCFWCTEDIFRRIKGVESVHSGYAGGHTHNPDYDQVSRGDTGHAEVVRVVFHPEEITYSDLLDVFFSMHDPTTPDRQGNDIGPQYRSIILTTSDEQDVEARRAIQDLQDKGVYDNPIVTQVQPLDVFYPAESVHERYYEKHPDQPYCRFVIAPKIKHFKRRHRDKLRA